MLKELQPLLSVLAVGLAVFLTGCNTNPVKSSGTQQQSLGITKVRFEFDSKMPDEIGIRKSVSGRFATEARAKINEADRMQTRARIAQMYVVFLNGFKTSFPRKAAQYGLEIAQPSEDAPELRIAVKSMSSFCDEMWCNPMFELTGKLVARDGKELWSVNVRNLPRPVPNFEQHYEFVEDAILEQLLDDKVIPMSKEQQAKRAKPRFLPK